MAEQVRMLPSQRLRDGRVIAVLRAPSAEAYAPVVEALVAGGITSIELTLTTQGTLDVLPDLVERFGAEAEVGVGTVLNTSDARTALERGAAYLVTPCVAPDVIAVAVRAGRPVYPGAFTPSEVASNWAAGATAVKLFPASHLGPAYVHALAGPLPDVSVIPSGGVALDEVGPWLDAGAVAVSLGGELIGDALRGGQLRELAARVRRARSAADAPGRA